MRHERIDPAGEGGAGELFTPANTPAINTKSGKSQGPSFPPIPAPDSGISIAAWCAGLIRDGYFKSVRVVDGALGPIGLIGSPLVCFGVGASWTAVWVERLPTGWSDPYRLFLAPNGKEAKAYALRLAEAIRTAAFNEEARREKLKAAYLREKFGGGL